MASNLVIVGISGVTCGGKTTLACQLQKCLPGSILISQDDYFRDVDDPEHMWIPELNHINFDILCSLDMEKMYNDVLNVIKNKQLAHIGSQKIQGVENVDDLKLRINAKLKKTKSQILLIEGFSIFNYKPLRDIFHLKYYFTLTREECFRRRNQRVYEPPDCPGYFEKCVWPEHEKQLEEVRQEIIDVKYFDGTGNNALHEVLLDIENLLN